MCKNEMYTIGKKNFICFIDIVVFSVIKCVLYTQQNNVLF
jgi:hypothetical protein